MERDQSCCAHEKRLSCCNESGEQKQRDWKLGFVGSLVFFVFLLLFSLQVVEDLQLSSPP